MGRVEDIITEKNLWKMPQSELDELVRSVLKDNSTIVASFIAGKEKALNALVGLAMEQAKARADAKDVISLIKYYTSTLDYVLKKLDSEDEE